MKKINGSWLIIPLLLAWVNSTAVAAKNRPEPPCSMVVNAGADKTICNGSNTRLNALVTNGTGPYTYSWSGGPLSNSSKQNPVASPTNGGTSVTSTNYTVVVTDVNGCVASDVVNVAVVPGAELLPNGDFESVTTSPTGRGAIENAQSWKKATGDADLFYTGYTGCELTVSPLPTIGLCNTSPIDYNCIGIPCNHFGFQDVNTINTYYYAGLWAGVGKGAIHTIKPTVDTTINVAVEAMAIPITRLVAGEKYRLTFKIVRAEKGEIDNYGVTPYASFKIKMSDGMVTNTNFQPLSADEITKGIVTNTQTWQQVDFLFTANSSYDFLYVESYIDSLLTINFNPNDPIEIGGDYARLTGLESYFYIDELSLKFECVADTVVVADAGDDHNICSGTTITLGGSPVGAGGAGPYTYYWSGPNGYYSTVANPSLVPAAGTYTVVVTDKNGVSSSDIVIVAVSSMNYDAGAPTYTQCPGVPTTIGGNATGGIAPYSYSWTPNTAINATNVAMPVVAPTQNTTYVGTVTDAAGCTRSDAVQFVILSTATANAGNDTTVCQGSPVTLKGKLTPSGIFIYRWNNVVGDSTLSIVANSTTSYAFEGEDERGCKVRDTVMVNVNQRPTVASANKEICLGSSTVIGTPATGGLAPYSYFWSNSLPNAAQHTVSPTANATYTVYAKDSRNCQSDVATIQVKVNPTPVANAGIDRLICLGGTTPIGATRVGSNEAGFTYSWSPPLGLNSTTIANPTANPTTTTNYVLAVTNIYGCTKRDTMKVTVNPGCSGGGPIGSPSPGDGTIPGCTGALPPNADPGVDKFICNGTSSPVGGAPTAWGGVTPYTYSWTGPGFTSTASNPTIGGFTNEARLYRLLVTDACGRNSGYEYVTVSIKSPTIPPTPDGSVCNGSSLSIGQPATGGVVHSNYTYTWTSTTGILPSGTPKGTVTPAVTTTYTLTAKDFYNCSAIDQITISVNPKPTINAGPDKSICSNDPAVSIGHKAGSGTPAYTYQWLPVRGLSSLTDSVVVAHPYVTTEYTVKVTDTKNCSAFDNVTVFVSESPYVNGGPAITMCQGETKFMGNPASKGLAPYTYQWTPTSYLSNPTGYYTAVSPPTTTTYTFTATDAAGCSKDTTVVVTVNPTPVAYAGPDLAICEGKSDTIGLPATISGPATISYNWYPSSWLSNANACPTVASPPVTTNYTVTATTEKGCAHSDVMEMQVFQTPEYVPNGDFEYGIDPVTGRGEIAKALPWIASTATPDLFDVNYTDCFPLLEPIIETCGLSPIDYNCVGVPCNHFGYQNAHSYGRYSGLYSAFGLETFANSRYDTITAQLLDESLMGEGMEVRLNEPLTIGRNYRFTMWVNRAEKGEVGTNSTLEAAGVEHTLLRSDVAPFSVKLSKDLVLGERFEGVNRPTILTGLIADTTNWVKVTVDFIASDSYEYLIIESNPTILRNVFFSSNGSPEVYLGINPGPDTDVSASEIAGWSLTNRQAWIKGGYSEILNHVRKTEYLHSYVYVDDVSIEEVCDLVPPLIVDAGVDATICTGFSANLGGSPSASYGTPGYTYQWRDVAFPATVISTSPNITVSPLVTTTYQLRVQDAAGQIKADYVTVNIIAQSEYIVNGDFEFGSEPILRGDIARAPGWFKATGDADLYDSTYNCFPVPNDLSPANVNCLDIPVNHFGNQNVRSTGERYAGLWSLIQLSEATATSANPQPPTTGGDGLPVDVDKNIARAGTGTIDIDQIVGEPSGPKVPPVRNTTTYTTQVAVEGIEIRFDKPLETDRFYTLGFYISKAERGETGDNVEQLPSIGNDIDTKHLLVDECAGYHVKFSTDSVTNILFRPVDRPIAHSGTVCDTTRWVYHYYNFKPTENFNYLVIESYPTDGFTSFFAAQTNGTNNNVDNKSMISGFQSYFYIDDVSLTESCATYEGGGSDMKSNSNPNYMANLLAKEALLKNDGEKKNLVTSVKNTSAASSEVMSLQVMPNPNAGVFVLQYALGSVGNQQSEIVISDAIGKELQRIKPQHQDGDKHNLEVNLKAICGEVNAGVYFIRLVNGDKSMVKKVTIIP